MKCSIYEAYEAANVNTSAVKLYTNARGLQQMREGNSFYVWTKKYANPDDTSLIVFEKDLAEDSKGNVYCVDGLDVQILE
jgi:hypothetical protein